MWRKQLWRFLTTKLIMLSYEGHAGMQPCLACAIFDRFLRSGCSHDFIKHVAGVSDKTAFHVIRLTACCLPPTSFGSFLVGHRNVPFMFPGRKKHTWDTVYIILFWPSSMMKYDENVNRIEKKEKKNQSFCWQMITALRNQGDKQKKTAQQSTNETISNEHH